MDFTLSLIAPSLIAACIFQVFIRVFLCSRLHFVQTPLWTLSWFARIPSEIRIWMPAMGKIYQPAISLQYLLNRDFLNWNSIPVQCQWDPVIQKSVSGILNQYYLYMYINMCPTLGSNLRTPDYKSSSLQLNLVWFSSYCKVYCWNSIKECLLSPCFTSGILVPTPVQHHNYHISPNSNCCSIGAW